MRTRKSWREKLEKEQRVRIVNIPPRMEKRFGRGKMLIPRPLDVDALIRRVERGKLITQAQIRERLAEEYNVDITCPITTGIFVNIVARTAEEDLQSGKKSIAPYWRVVNSDGGLNPKFPGGVELQAERLMAEGHTIIEGRGKKPPRVKDFERYLVKS